MGTTPIREGSGGASTVVRFGLFAALLAGVFYAGRTAHGIFEPGTSRTSPSARTARASDRAAPTEAVSATETASRDPLATFLAEPAAHRRNLALWAQLRTAGEARTRELLAETESLPAGPARDSARHLIFRRWGELNPSAALSATAGLEAPARRLADAGIVRGWSTVDPAAAFDWCLDPGPRSSGFERSGGLNEFMESLRETRRFAELASRVAKLTGGITAPGSQIPSGFAAGWAEDDLERAIAWANALPDRRTKRNATFGILAAIGPESPDLALSFAQTVGSPEDRITAIAAVIHRWSNRDPEAAYAAITTKLETADRAEPLAAHISAIAATAPRLAVDRLATIADLSTRERAAAELSAKLNRIDQPALAAEVALLWFQESRRLDGASEVIRQWQRRDPAAAGRFVNESPVLTPAMRTVLRSANPPKS